MIGILTRRLKGLSDWLTVQEVSYCVSELRKRKYGQALLVLRHDSNARHGPTPTPRIPATYISPPRLARRADAPKHPLATLLARERRQAFLEWTVREGQKMHLRVQWGAFVPHPESSY
jgi:hypothetical protein